jgi:hypothetical protein
MKSFFSLIPALAFTLTLIGCAHPINMKPENDKLASRATSSPVIDKKLAYFIPESRMTLEVTSPGGGGDLVKYTPYRDIETGLYKILSESFKDITKAKSSLITADMKKDGITLMLQPEITTTSSSESILTWPPTKFGVMLTCNFYDEKDVLVHKVSVTGSGEAEFSEFKGNFGLAANRATTDALNKLLEALNTSAELRK